METTERFRCETCVKQTRFSPDFSNFSVVESGPFFRLRNLATNSTAEINTGGDIFDHDFYPGFDQNNPLTECVLIASRNRPIHLFNTRSLGSVSAYTAYSVTEEIIHPITLKFSPQCKSIIAGFPSSTVKVWDVQRPGRQSSDLVLSTRKSRGSIKGIVSAVEFASEDSFFAGTYSKEIAMFDLRNKDQCMRIGSGLNFGGVVQLKFIPDLNIVFSGHRTDMSIRGFDVRYPDQPVLELPRVVKTYQRFEFDILAKKNIIVSGDHYGDLTVFDLKKDGAIILHKNLSSSPLVSVSVSSRGNIISGSGIRRFADIIDSEDEAGIPDSFDASASFFGLHTIDLP